MEWNLRQTISRDQEKIKNSNVKMKHNMIKYAIFPKKKRKFRKQGGNYY